MATPTTIKFSSQMGVGEDGGRDDEHNWWESWDRHRRMAVAQVLCYVVYAIYLYSLNHNSECDVHGESARIKKRKARVWEREFERLGEAIVSVAEAIREGNSVMERDQQRLYSEEEVFTELVKIGLERPLRYAAYDFLLEDPGRVWAFFRYPVEERKFYLLQMMYGPD